MKEAGKWKISKVNKMKSCPSILSNRERNKLSNGERENLETCLIKWLNSLSLAFIHSLLWPGWAEKLKCQLYSDISCQDAKIARGQCAWNPNHNKHMQGRHTHLLQYIEIVHWGGADWETSLPCVKVKKVASLKKISTGNCRGFDNKHS